MILESIVNKSPIVKGWSGDQKYCAVTADGTKYLLRISSIDRLERKRREYEKMSEVSQLDIPMCLPVEFGICDEGVYSIQSWIDGVDAEDAMMAMRSEQQYSYGLDAGRILASIHTIPAPANAPDWEIRFNAKIDRRIAMYENCELKYDGGGDLFLAYLTRNRHLLKDRPQSYQHGDYHIGNMMIDSHGVLTIIDFDRDDLAIHGGNLPVLSGARKQRRLLLPVWWMATLAAISRWNSGNCLLFTSAQILSVRFRGQCPLERDKFRSCGSRLRRC